MRQNEYRLISQGNDTAIWTTSKSSYGRVYIALGAKSIAHSGNSIE